MRKKSQILMQKHNKTFMLFHYWEYYPEGGMRDYVDSFESLEFALDYIEKNKSELGKYIHIFDLESGQVVWDNSHFNSFDDMEGTVFQSIWNQKKKKMKKHKILEERELEKVLAQYEKSCYIIHRPIPKTYPCVMICKKVPSASEKDWLDVCFVYPEDLKQERFAMLPKGIRDAYKEWGNGD